MPGLFGSSLLVAVAFFAGCSTNPPTGDDDDSSGGAKGGGAGATANAGRPSGGSPGAAGAAGGSVGAGAGGISGSGGSAGTGLAPGGAGAGPAGMGGSLPTAGAGGSLSGASGLGGAAGSPLGGAAGSGPTAGSTGTAGGAAGSGGSKATGFFMEDFESSTTGMQPTGWDTFISYQKNNPMNPAGSILALTDTLHVHGGTKAVHFHGDGQPAQIVRALPAGTTKLYVRVWVWMTRALGQHTEQSANHETLIALRKKSGTADDEVRFGEIKGVIGTNEVPSDNISPTMDKWHMAGGPVVPANAWSCIEVAFLADSSPNTLRATAGGMLIHEITSIGTDQWQNGPIPATWLATKFAATPAEIVFGWQSFSSAANDVWMDDIVLSNAPIGCD